MDTVLWAGMLCYRDDEYPYVPPRPRQVWCGYMALTSPVRRDDSGGNSGQENG